MDWFIGRSRRKDKEAVDENERLYLKPDFVRERLVDGDLTPFVALPFGVDCKEWLASNTISFFEHINALSACLSDYCKPTICSSMTGPGNVQYHWIDDRGKKYKCTAPQYVDYAMSHTQKLVSDETVFPTKYGNAFPSSFKITIKKIHRLLLHVLAHIYQCHCREATALELHGHLNTITLHFLLFNRQFGLVEDKETEVLRDLFEHLRHPGKFDSLTKNAQNLVGGISVSPLFPPPTTTQQIMPVIEKHSTLKPLARKEKDQNNGFARDSFNACAIVTL